MTLLDFKDRWRNFIASDHPGVEIEDVYVLHHLHGIMEDLSMIRGFKLQQVYIEGDINPRVKFQSTLISPIIISGIEEGLTKVYRRNTFDSSSLTDTMPNREGFPWREEFRRRHQRERAEAAARMEELRQIDIASVNQPQRERRWTSPAFYEIRNIEPNPTLQERMISWLRGTDNQENNESSD